MAEITATQAILIDLVCTLGRDGKISTQKAQEVVDAAHNAKYKEAVELLRFAYSKAAKFHLETPASGERARKEEHNE
jgi:ribosomal protein L22